MIYLLSCTSQSTELSFVFGAGDDTEEMITESTGDWHLGDVETCDVEVQHPSWWDASALLWGEQRGGTSGQPAACIALYPEEDSWMVAATTREINVRWGHLYEEDYHDILVSPSSVRLRVEDLNGDGELDADEDYNSLEAPVLSQRSSQWS